MEIKLHTVSLPTGDVRPFLTLKIFADTLGILVSGRSWD